ncbi:MAG: carboxypeptidase regulatory-like domain-containing protein [Deltaproteobacteria bacterium]|nr:carboxypeptidase regulatory-like domain-containing protein [Deltaproteobacteria bacterium]MBW2678753.1 carboxypeptidase regulatory-like domain-containing protein [Deltaproteobacteria bacterium]
MNTWKFKKTIDVPSSSGEFSFVISKMEAGQEEDVWESEKYGQPDKTDYTIDLDPEFSVMHYHIQGLILEASIGLEGVTVNLKALNGDPDRSGETASYGQYSFADIPSGDYLVTPGKTGFSFNPVSTSVSIEDASELEINFNAQAD